MMLLLCRIPVVFDSLTPPCRRQFWSVLVFLGAPEFPRQGVHFSLRHFLTSPLVSAEPLFHQCRLIYTLHFSAALVFFLSLARKCSCIFGRSSRWVFQGFSASDTKGAKEWKRFWKECKSCRSPKMLQNEFLVTKNRCRYSRERALQSLFYLIWFWFYFVLSASSFFKVAEETIRLQNTISDTDSPA